MKVLLIFPPHFVVDQPYLALPSLVAFLRSRGVANIAHWDCNVESFWYFLKPENLMQMVARVREERMRLEARGAGADVDLHSKLWSLCRAEAAAGPVVDSIEEAAAFFREPPAGSMPEDYAFATRVISAALNIVSAAHYPTDVSLSDFTMKFSREDATAVSQAATSRENPFLPYFEGTVLPRLEAANVDLLGLSVTAMSQIIPAFTLARLVRERLPRTRIVVGGQIFNRLVDRVLTLPNLFQYIDFFILNEGETALLRLIESVSGELALEDVPNLVYLNPATKAPTRTAIHHREDITRLPPPDFSDLDLTQYLAPHPVLPYQPVRGCYWSKCTFCNQFAVHVSGARAKSPVDVAHELSHLNTAYGAKHFAMVNESIHPKMLAEYAEAILDANLDIEWYAGARFEATLTRDHLALLKRSGCQKLYFGLESGSQEILNAMRKGISLTQAKRILQDCSDLNIPVHLFIMLGFPAETSETLTESKRVIWELANLAPREAFTFYISVFQLKPCTYIFEHPERFNITSIHEDCEVSSLEYLYSFETGTGSKRSEYEMERTRLEAKLDELQGGAWSPENIIHYLTMREVFQQRTAPGRLPKSKLYPVGSKLASEVFTLRGGLGFCATAWNGFRNRNAGHSPMPTMSNLVYDVMFDEMFELGDRSAWEALQQLRGQFTRADLVDRIAAHQQTGTDPDVGSTADALIVSGLVIPANCSGE
jgi:radical SAM superfamily enzyme YgiQ (UPF0313 family)